MRFFTKKFSSPGARHADDCRHSRADGADDLQKDDRRSLFLGIEKTWYETTENTKYTVSYKGKEYIREDRTDPSAEKLQEVHIFQVGMNYYFVGEPVSFDGERTVSGEELKMTNGEQDGNLPRQIACLCQKCMLFTSLK